ncbi:DUF7577 domain-containing protein [Halorubrum sp. SY-15]|jgi:hypothetical protein|uniref:DUF7577 domain-containing protein n=1 Tax=Halorubrum sp. SY-15 TaxID=3402277 RepID=UPI003EC0322B
MSGALLAALFVAVLVINLAITLAVLRGDVDLERVLGSGGAGPDSEHQTGFAAVMDASERGEAASEPADTPPPLETSEATVACQSCGATNRARYRYCRWCVQPALGGDGARPSRDAAATQRPL